MHYLLFTVGTIGDLNPYLGIGAVLRRGGNRVSVLTNAAHQPQVEAAGLACIPLAGDIAGSYIDQPGFFHPSRSWKMALEHCFAGPMRQTYNTIAGCASREPVAVVSAAWGFGARIAHEKLGTPLITIHLEPHNIRSLHQSGKMPPPMMMGSYIPRWFKRLQFWVADRCFIDPRIAPQVNQFRRELGLPARQRLLAEWWNSPQQIIGMYPEWFAPPQPDWPGQIELAGFPRCDTLPLPATGSGAIDFAARTRPLVFTAGSNRLDANGFFATAIACCQQLDRCGVLLTRQEVAIPAGLKDRVRRFDYVAFEKLLPHAAALVHHGGAGTAAAALRCGVPQLVSPTVHGTPDIASRLKQLGVAAVVRPARFKPATVYPLLERLLKNAATARCCQLYQQKMADDKSLERACEIIERIARTNACASGAAQRKNGQQTV